MKLYNNNHSVFVLEYRLILVINKRKKILEKSISESLKNIFNRIAVSYNIELVQWNCNKDYIDIEFRGNPNSELSKFINAFKSASSRIIKKEYPSIIERLENNGFWSKSFFLTTKTNVGLEIINKYLITQEKRGENSGH